MISLKIDKVVVYIIVISFIAMTIPYIFNLGGHNVFLKDFYAKRIMVFLSFPFYLCLIYLYLTPVNSNKTLSKNFVFYLFISLVLLINSFILKNSLSLIILDFFIICLPLFFYILVYKTSFCINTYKTNFLTFVVIASALVVIGIKLQFSYFSLLGIIYIIFFTKFNYKGLIFIPFLPFLITNSLIGKSSLIMLAILVGYFFLFDRKLITKQKKIYLAIIPSVIITIGVIVFWNKIEHTGAYRNTVYFLKNTDFKKLKFKDMSTSHRLFEAERVIEEFDNSNTYLKVFGKGFGATIDLSETKDVAVQATNSNLKKVRHIHIGFFAVLYRYGIIGLIVYFLFIRKMIISCNYVLKKSKDYTIVLGALYILIIIFDSFITFPHMMSNIMFWLIVFVILRQAEAYKEKEYINNTCFKLYNT